MLTLPDGTVSEQELTGDGIEGGEVHTLHAGDVLHIPAGIPHAHQSVGSGARMHIIKIPVS